MNKKPMTAEIVYVAKDLIEIDGKTAIQVAALIERTYGKPELETFQYKCNSETEAKNLKDIWTAQVKQHGLITVFSMKGINSPKKAKGF